MWSGSLDLMFLVQRVAQRPDPQTAPNPAGLPLYRAPLVPTSSSVWPCCHSSAGQQARQTSLWLQEVTNYFGPFAMELEGRVPSKAEEASVDARWGLQDLNPQRSHHGAMKPQRRWIQPNTETRTQLPFHTCPSSAISLISATLNLS